MKKVAIKFYLECTLIILALAWMPVTSSWAAFSLAAEVNPNPVAASELLDVQISVSTTSLTGALTLRLPWPDNLGTSPSITDGGSCAGGCFAGNFLSWNLGVLGASTVVSVGFNETVGVSVPNGTTILLEFELLEEGVEVATLSLPVEVQEDSPLEVAVDPLADPVAPGGTLVYEIAYGNAGAASAENTELVFPVPAGTTFTSATGGGQFAGGEVSWNLGSLGASSGGHERVTVQVDALAEGSLLTVDAATLSADVGFLPRQARAMAVSRVVTERLQLEIEANPGPVEPGQLADTQITVSNPGNSSTGTLSVRMWMPEDLGTSPYFAGGGACPGGCFTGNYVSWNLGVLGPHKSVTVSINENLDSGVVSGSLLPLEVELLESGLAAGSRSHTLLVQADSPLEVAVDPLADPVAPGGTLVYEIAYGNAGAASAENTELVFPVPAGTTFTSATGGGQFAGGQVSWNLGSLGASSGGHERVTVQVDALAEGSLLTVDAATLSADVGFLPRQARAMAVSRVVTERLQLEIEANPGPVEPGQLADTQITVSNPGNSSTGALTLRMIKPKELGNSPFFTGGGACSGGCFTGNYVSWNLGVLGPHKSVTVSINENLDSGVVSGSLLPLEVELLESGLAAGSRSHTLLVQADSPLEVAVDALTDPVAPGGTLVYEIAYGNAGAASAENTELVFPVPAGTTFTSATGGGQFAGGEVSWDLGSLGANSGGHERVTVQVDALAEGSLLSVDAVTLSADVGFLPRQARAMAVSRVATELLQLDLTVTPNPVDSGQLLDADISITNVRAGNTGTLTLRVQWPEELHGSPDITGVGGCSGGCFAGNYLSWNLGVLGPTASVSVGFSEDVRSSVADGTLIPLEFELLEGALSARTIIEYVLVNPFTDHDNDGIADVFDEDDDNDGIPDWWEILHGLDPFDDTDADDDPDMDGKTNLEEFLAGSDPNASEDTIFMDGFENP